MGDQENQQILTFNMLELLHFRFKNDLNDLLIPINGKSQTGN